MSRTTLSTSLTTSRAVRSAERTRETAPAASSTGGAGIRLVELTKQYPGQPVPAVDHVSMDIAPGEMVMFLGPSGCGKTTTMKMINRLIEPTGGQVLIDGTDVATLDPHELRRGIGYVIQQIGLFPHLTVRENITLVPELIGWSKPAARRRADELLELVGLDPSRFRGRHPRRLSGGQQQRVGVARALAADPPVMLMDEPFGATDPITRENLQSEFLKLHKELGKTIIFVTHDFDEAVRLGDRIAVLGERSVIEQFDTPERILAAPANDYVASFVGSAAAIRHLGLTTAGEAVRLLGPDRARAADGAVNDTVDDEAPTTVETTSARDVVDLMLRSGHSRVRVRSADGQDMGTLDFDHVCSLWKRSADGI